MIEQFVRERGADAVAFVDISDMPHELTQGYPRAVVLCIALSRAFVLKQYHTGTPPAAEHDEFLQGEQRADAIADALAQTLTERGYSAYSQSEESNLKSGNFNHETRASRLPHKTLALRAGLGFIGKNNLLITEAYGCAFCMCTVLTDAPLAVEATTQTTASRCGECHACIESCPAGALRGRDWDPHISDDAAQVRDALLDVEKCSCPLRCMLVCPWTLRYARLPEQKGHRA